jgi:integrase
LSVALDKYLRREKKRFGDDRARERFGLTIPFVIAMIGDKQVAQIDKRDLGKVDLLLPDIPKRTRIPVENRQTLVARYLYAKKHGWEGLERLSETTICNSYHSSINTFFDWLHQKAALPEPPYKFEYVQKDNPAAEDRDVFSPEEAIKLASLPLFTGCESVARIWNPGSFFAQSFLYWGYVIALVTGMRPAEIAQVRCSDLVSIEDEDGEVWFFDFTDRLKDRKTSSSRRMVPLLPLVIELGLVERRDILMAAGHDRLFPEWKPLVKTSGEVKHGHALSKSWQYIKRKFGFTRDGVTLYSARHWFAQRLDEVGQLAERSRHLAMGHATQGKSKARLTYGAQTLSLGIARLINSINDPTLAKVSKILLDAKQRADHGELQRIGVLDLIERELDVVEA